MQGVLKKKFVNTENAYIHPLDLLIKIPWNQLLLFKNEVLHSYTCLVSYLKMSCILQQKNLISSPDSPSSHAFFAKISWKYIHNSFTKWITKELIWRNISTAAVHSAVSLEYFSWNQSQIVDFTQFMFENCTLIYRILSEINKIH